MHATHETLGCGQCLCLCDPLRKFEQTQEAVSESRSGGLLGAFKEVPQQRRGGAGGGALRGRAARQPQPTPCSPSS